MSKIKKVFLTEYGSVWLGRVYCDDCECMTIVLQKRKQCCDARIEYVERDELELKRVRMSRDLERKSISRELRKRILKRHDNKCEYCDKELTIRICYIDHFIPVHHAHDMGEHNLVPACRRCNLIKGARVFSSLEQAREYIKEKRK